MLKKIIKYSIIIQKWSLGIAIVGLYLTWTSESFIFAVPARISIVLFFWTTITRIVIGIFVKDDVIPLKGAYGCPKCYSEYNADVEICVDCNIPLKEISEEE